METLKNKHLDKCMKTIINKCRECDGIWKGDSLFEFHNHSKNYDALRVLADDDYIKLYIDDFDNIYCVMLLEKGVSYFSVKEQKRKEFILNSVVVPIIISAITTLITIGLTKLFSFEDANKAMLASDLLNSLITLI